MQWDGMESQKAKLLILRPLKSTRGALRSCERLHMNPLPTPAGSGRHRSSVLQWRVMGLALSQPLCCSSPIPDKYP